MNSMEVLFEIDALPSLPTAYKKMNESFFYFHFKKTTIGFSFSEKDDLVNMEYSIKTYCMPSR